MSSPSFEVTPLTGTFGATVHGVALGALEDGARLTELLTEHLLVVFPGQFLTHEEQSRVAKLLGEPTPAHPVVPGHRDYPEILELDAQQGGKNARWHTDVTFVEVPPAASVLVVDETPPVGGDTMWADARSAYEQLAAPLRGAVDQLEAVHRIAPLAYWGEPFDSALGRDDAASLLEEAAKVGPVIHPVVRVHPVTERPSLFVNPGFTSHVLGLSRHESEHLLALLYDHLTQPERTLRHRWQPGDVVLWDNRATLHYAIDDYGDEPRKMRRITLRGTQPVGISGQRSRPATNPLDAVR